MLQGIRPAFKFNVVIVSSYLIKRGENMFKKIITAVLATLMFLIVLPTKVLAEENIITNEYKYTNLNSKIIDFFYNGTYYHFELNDEFNKANLNDVIFYLDDVPIYKYQILNEHVESKSNVISYSSDMERTSNSNYTQNYAYVTAPYECAEVKTTTTAPRFSQVAYVSYLTSSLGSVYAQSLQSNVSDIFVNQLLSILIAKGLGGAAGLTYDLISSFNAAYKASIASSIWELTNAGKKVKISHAISTYGSGYGVFEWYGSRIETYRSYTGNITSETLDYIKYF